MLSRRSLVPSGEARSFYKRIGSTLSSPSRRLHYLQHSHHATLANTPMHISARVLDGNKVGRQKRKLNYPELRHTSARVRFEISVSWSSAQNDHRNLNKTEIIEKHQHSSRSQRPIVRLGSTCSSLWRHQGQGLSTEYDSDDLNCSLQNGYCISLLPPPNEWQRQVTFGSDHLALFALHIPSSVTFTVP